MSAAEIKASFRGAGKLVKKESKALAELRKIVDILVEELHKTNARVERLEPIAHKTIPPHKPVSRAPAQPVERRI